MSRPPSPEPAARMRHRPLQAGDVDECLALLPPWLELNAAERAGLPALWRRLADDPAAVTGVIEDLARPPGRRMQGWGATLVMPAGWYEAFAPGGQFDAARAAGATRRVYAGLLDGTLALPGEREIGRANAGAGIVLFAVHYWQHPLDLGTPYALQVLNTAHEAFRVMHSGYRVRTFLQQSLLDHERWITSSGSRRRTDPVSDDPAHATVLYALLREEAAAMMPGSTLRHIFIDQPPRFRLSAAQRRLLWLALFDEDDEALMQRLEVSVHGLKKLWRGIYERVEDVEPEFFGDNAGAEDGKRGPEKRRQVLAYVRQRPEELRAWAAA